MCGEWAEALEGQDHGSGLSHWENCGPLSGPLPTTLLPNLCEMFPGSIALLKAHIQHQATKENESPVGFGTKM